MLRSHWLAHPDNTHATTISEHSWWLVSGHAAGWLTRCAQTGESSSRLFWFLVVGQQEIRTASRQNFRVRQTEQPKRERFRAGIGPTDRKALVKYVEPLLNENTVMSVNPEVNSATHILNKMLLASPEGVAQW